MQAAASACAGAETPTRAVTARVPAAATAAIREENPFMVITPFRWGGTTLRADHFLRTWHYMESLVTERRLGRTLRLCPAGSPGHNRLTAVWALVPRPTTH
ncbi:hypothetical protein GCM10010402_76990 [Actinomadura luteofluorescens]